MSTVDQQSKIPNNVDLHHDKRLQRALEQWQPNYLQWWMEMGPTDFQAKDIYLRTAISVDADTALEKGLVTFAPDEIDWEDEVRLAIEERASLSPDALTGMEANLRFAGPETMETKIFGRLSAWQNWIFQRPNAAGPEGALTRYGSGTRPSYDPDRT